MIKRVYADNLTLCHDCTVPAKLSDNLTNRPGFAHNFKLSDNGYYFVGSVKDSDNDCPARVYCLNISHYASFARNRDIVSQFQHGIAIVSTIQIFRQLQVSCSIVSEFRELDQFAESSADSRIWWQIRHLPGMPGKLPGISPPRNL